ncbi:hypothetical protein D3C87_1283360 [compost metagenome]
MGHEFQRDFRVPGEELRQARYQPLGAQRGHAGDMEDAAAPLSRDQLHAGCLDLVEARADTLQIALAGIGQHQPLADTLEQFHAQERLQAAHLLAHGSLCDV